MTGFSNVHKGKAMQRAVAKFYREIGRCLVWENSDPGMAKGIHGRRGTPGRTPGLPDLYVIHPPTGYRWWHEVKSGKGRLTKAQQQFKDAEEGAEGMVIVGAIDEAKAQLSELGVIWLEGDDTIRYTGGR